MQEIHGQQDSISWLYGMRINLHTKSTHPEIWACVDFWVASNISCEMSRQTSTPPPKSSADYKSVESQITEAAPSDATAYRLFLEPSGVRLPNKQDFGTDYYNLGDYPLGAPPGLARILFLDAHGKVITQRPQRVIQIHGIPESSTAERPDRPYQSVEDKADEEGDPQIASEGDFLTEINKQEVRRQRLHNIARARRLSRNDALLETMQGLVSDTLSSVGRIDEVTKKHHEAQLEITDKLLDLARKAQPPPPPPDWPSMFEKITGHLSTVVLGAMKAREALPAPKITPALPAPEKDSALDDVKEALLKATAEIAETRKRTDRIEEMFLQLLAAKQQPEARPPEARPPEARPPEAKPPEAKPEPKPPEPKPPEPKQPEPKQDATDSDDPPSPPPIAANESTTNAPAEPAPIARNPHRVAWNRIKRMIVSLTDGDIIAFLVQPQLAVMYLGILAAMVPPC